MFNKIFLIVALIGVPLSVLGKTLHVSNNYVCCVLYYDYRISGFYGESDRKFGNCIFPRIGGLLNATFGNAVELIISILPFRQD